MAASWKKGGSLQWWGQGIPQEGIRNWEKEFTIVSKAESAGSGWALEMLDWVTIR